MVAINIGDVHVPNMLTDSGATCNLISHGTWEWLKSQRIQWESSREAKVLLAYGCTKPLETLRIFTAIVVSPDTKAP